MSSRLPDGLRCALCGANEDADVKVITCNCCFRVARNWSYLLCSRCVHDVAVTLPQFRSWASESVSGYARDAFGATLTVHRYSRKRRRRSLYYQTRRFRILLSLQSRTVAETSMYEDCVVDKCQNHSLHPNERGSPSERRFYRIGEYRMTPLWVPNEMIHNCEDCGISFTLLRRRHHCRLCGRVFCDDCTKHRRVVCVLGIPL